MTRNSHSVLLLSAALLSGCAGNARSPESPVVVAGSVCSGVRKLDGQSLGGANEAAPQVGVVAALSEPAQNGAADLLVMELGTGRLLWKKSIQASARPQVLRDVVVTASGDSLVAFDLATGKEHFRNELGRPQFIGAAQSGETLVITTGTASWDPKQRGSSLIALDARSGSEHWRRDVPYSLSAPVARAGRAVVVSDHADLWTLHLESGKDTGCGPVGGNTVEWLDSAPGGLLFGASEARQLGANAQEAASTLALARTDLPGRPFIRGSSYLPVPAARSAHGRVAAIAPLRTTDQGPALAGDMFYFVFYRDVFGFRADGTLAWAQLVDTDVARAQASDGGLWVLTEAGILLQLDAATGEPKHPHSLGRKIASADLRTAPPAAAGAGPAGPEAVALLQASLRRIADDTDARLLPARGLAVDELARLDTASATGDLLAVYSAPNTPTGLRERIAKRLRERTIGGEYLVAALAQHQDFLEERPVPPLRAIVPGLVTQHETRAVPGLVDQLFDPNTPVTDLGMVVSAIDALSGDAGREPLRKFFSMYHADTALAGDPSALVIAAQGLLARSDAPSRTMLETARDDSRTSPALREQLASLLAPPPAAAPEPAEEVAAAPVEAPPPPIELRSLLDAARPQLTPCVEEAHARSPKLTSVRMWFVALPNGSVRDVRVAPLDERLATCLDAKLSALRLPNDRKQLVSYQLALPVAAPEPKPKEAAASGEFWARAEQRAPKTARAPQAPPWWEDKNPLFVVMDTQGRPAAQQPTALQPAAQQPGAEHATAARPQPTAANPAKPATAPVASAPQPPATQPGEASKLKPAPATQEPAPAEDAWWVPVQEPKK